MLKLDELKQILNSYGIKKVDDILLAQSLIFSKERILNEIAQEEIPIQLLEFWKKFALSDYLNTLQGTSKLEDVELSERAIKAITEGDTRIEYSESLSASDKMSLFIRQLINSLDYKELYSFRKMRW